MPSSDERAPNAEIDLGLRPQDLTFTGQTKRPGDLVCNDARRT